MLLQVETQRQQSSVSPHSCAEAGTMRKQHRSIAALNRTVPVWQQAYPPAAWHACPVQYVNMRNGLLGQEWRHTFSMKDDKNLMIRLKASSSSCLSLPSIENMSSDCPSMSSDRKAKGSVRGSEMFNLILESS